MKGNDPYEVGGKVRCPACGSQPGRPCFDKFQRPRATPHHLRVREAKRQAKREARR